MLIFSQEMFFIALLKTDNINNSKILLTRPKRYIWSLFLVDPLLLKENNQIMENQTVFGMDNLHNISADTYEEDFFPGLYKLRPSVIIGLFLTLISICVLIPVLYSIIWYEKFGSDKKRTVLNKLVGSVCWYTIVVYMVVQIPELIRYCYGPLPTFLCYLHLIIKSTLAIQLMLIFDAISILRYIFIFWLKNPYNFSDDFWNVFINLWISSFSLMTQIVFVILPGT